MAARHSVISFDQEVVPSRSRVKNNSEKAAYKHMIKEYGLLVAVEATFILLFGLFVKYDEVSADTDTASPSHLEEVYPLFQDVHVMVFIGFGFLMTFLRKYGYSAIGMTFLLGCIAFQWAILCRGFFACLISGNWEKIALNVET